LKISAIKSFERQFSAEPSTISTITSWYLADLSKAQGKQELFTHLDTGQSAICDIPRYNEETKKLRLEAEEKPKEKERKKAVLEAMSPEERDIAAVNDPKITENQVIEIYNGIDDFSEENKTKLAQALRSYWEKHSKWKKKKCTKNNGIRFKRFKQYWGNRCSGIIVLHWRE
jgi:hypothetical protein